MPPLVHVVLFAAVFSVIHCELCVLEKLLTISKPLCPKPVNCPVQTEAEKEKSSVKTEIVLVSLGSPSLSHFQSIQGTSDDDKPSSGSLIPDPICNENDIYRSHDGSCNNLNHTAWGKSSSTPFLRILYPRYSPNTTDGNALSKSGSALPYPRKISTTLFPDHNRPWANHTLLIMQWGQLITHDTALSPSSLSTDVNCCKTPVPGCYPIVLPKGDEFYSKYNQTCTNMIRATSIDLQYGCRRFAYQLNDATHYLDMSNIYGATNKIASTLRQFDDGLLQIYTLKDSRQFPKLSKHPQFDCNSPKPNITCFRSGDKRINQNTELTALQTVLIREHNRIARKLKELNPHWKDEQLYQESRSILIAQFQHITYGEWMPLIVGQENMDKYKLTPLKEGYSKYDNQVNAATINSFTAGAFRLFHSQIQGTLTMYNGDRCPFRKINISDYFAQPAIVTEDNNLDAFLLGLTLEPSQSDNRYFTKQMTELMFRGSLPYGEDIVSFDIQRGRDHGIPSYNTMRQLCGLKEADDFDDLNDVMTDEDIELLKSVYEDVDDVDYFVGIVLEKLLPGVSTGPTALCLIIEQFARKKVGDRFWYEVGGQPHSFSKDQLQELRKASFSRLLCDNSDNITTIQINSFLSPSDRNPIVNCTRIPSINLDVWKSN